MPLSRRRLEDYGAFVGNKESPSTGQPQPTDTQAHLTLPRHLSTYGITPRGPTLLRACVPAIPFPYLAEQSLPVIPDGIPQLPSCHAFRSRPVPPCAPAPAPPGCTAAVVAPTSTAKQPARRLGVCASTAAATASLRHPPGEVELADAEVVVLARLAEGPPARDAQRGSRHLDVALETHQAPEDEQRRRPHRHAGCCTYM